MSRELRNQIADILFVVILVSSLVVGIVRALKESKSKDKKKDDLDKMYDLWESIAIKGLFFFLIMILAWFSF